MPRRLQLTKPASEDIDDIWFYTADRYDIEQAIAYSDLIQQALDDIEEDPERPSSLERPEFGPHVRSYHIALSKKRSGTGIKSPRHVLIYTLEFEDEIYVLRVLHDRMDPRNYIQKV